MANEDVGEFTVESMVVPPPYDVAEFVVEGMVVPPPYDVAEFVLESISSADFALTELVVECLIRPSSVVPPLRQRQRDDGVRQRSRSNPPRSRQASLRQGPANTYA